MLVNNAAFADWSETVSTADLENSWAVLDTNLFGTWRVCLGPSGGFFRDGEPMPW